MSSRKSTYALWLRLSFCLVFALSFFSQTLSVRPERALADGGPVSGPVTTYVTRSGNKLMLGDQEYRIAGVNSEWLLLHTYESADAVQSGKELAYYYTNQEVDDFFATAQEMGSNTVRMWLTVGCPKCLEPSLGSWNETAFKRFDYVLKSASDHGIRLIVNLTSTWDYAEGGDRVFTEWRNVNDDQFFSNSTVIGDFEAFISQVVNRTNTLTNTQYKNDPTILAYETDNEASPPVAWTQQIADYIKSIDSNHLVADGHYGVDPAALSLKNVDMYTNHCYAGDAAGNSSCLNGDSRPHDANKVFYIGEFYTAGMSVDQLDVSVNNPNTNGDLVYELQPHHHQYGFTHHYNRHDQYYPLVTAQSDTLNLRTHFYHQRGITTPPPSLSVAVPTITNTNTNDKTVAWSGVVGGNKYTIERSTQGDAGPWTVACDQCATDLDAPWHDSNRPDGRVWYRIKAYNLDGSAGPYSTVYQSDPDLALNAAVNASSSLENGTWGTAKLVDGVQYSESVFPNNDGVTFLGWNPSVSDAGYTSNPPQSTADSNEWIEIDLSANQTFNHVKLYPRTDVSSTDPDGYAANFPVNFTIQVKPDGGSYSNVQDIMGQSNPDIDPVTYDVSAQTARYIKINATKLGTPAFDEPGKYRLQFAEVEVFNS